MQRANLSCGGHSRLRHWYCSLLSVFSTDAQKGKNNVQFGKERDTNECGFAEMHVKRRQKLIVQEMSAITEI